MKKLFFLLSFALTFTLNAQVTATSLKAQVDTDITHKTGNGAISKVNVGKNIKDAIDFANTKAPIASPTFTGTPMAPTASVGNASAQIANCAHVLNSLAAHKPYKELKGYIQWNSGTSNFDFHILQNDFSVISATFSFGSPGGGSYLLNASQSNIFVENKTLIFLGQGNNPQVVWTANRGAGNQINLYQYYNGSPNSGNFLDPISVLIQVYN